MPLHDDRPKLSVPGRTLEAMGTGEQGRRGGNDDRERPRDGGPDRDEPESPRLPSGDLSKNVAGVGVTHEAARRRWSARVDWATTG
jgi:hypothetical protein